MVILIWLLTVILVLTALFLILLVLVQLPKKETGGGLAFGGSTTDALIGAGSGNALTAITRYAATVFLVLSIILTILYTQRRKSSSAGIDRALERRATTAPAATTPAVTPDTKAGQTAPQLVPLATNTTLQPIIIPAGTNPPLNNITPPAAGAATPPNPSVPASSVGAPALQKPGTPVAEPQR
ncbi:MAG: preprotein translocase subunit SecG [Verrucomicrobiales bacterium]